MKRVKTILLCAICLSLLIGCARMQGGQNVSGDIAEIKESKEDTYNDDIVFSLSDFSHIIPGCSTYRDVKEICGDSNKFYIDLEKIRMFLPTDNGNDILIEVSVPENIVKWLTYSEDDPYLGDCEELRLETTLVSGIDALSRIIPGISNYQDVYKVFQFDYGAFPRDNGLSIIIPSANYSELVVLIDPQGIVSSIQHLSTPKSFTESVDASRIYGMDDFLEIIPGQSTYEELKAITQEDGMYFASPTEGFLILPAGYGKRVTIRIALPEQLVVSIAAGELSTPAGEEVVSKVPDGVAIDDFVDIVPLESTYQELYKICQQNYGEFPRERGLCVSIPFENEKEICIKIKPNGIISEISYYMK